jgi:two-component system, cell cycle sensor histidine kinase and response regulator CckA
MTTELSPPVAIPEADDDGARRLAFDACPESLAIVCDGRIVDCNFAFARLFGYAAAEDLHGKPLADLLPREHICTRIRDDEAGLTSVSCGYPGCVFVGRRKDGMQRKMEASCSEYEANGRKLMVLSVRDVTDRERRRVARDTEARFRTIFHAASIGICQCTMDGHIAESNPVLQQMLGYTQAELRGTDFRSYIPLEDRQRDQHQHAALASGSEEAYESETRFLRHNGEIGWQLLKVSVLRGPDTRPEFLLVLAEDLTARRAAEQRLRNSQKMEAIGRLVAGVSHDFNNLLTAISLYSGLIASSIHAETPAAHYMDELKFATQQGSTLIQQLLTVSRQQPVDPQILNIGDVVEEMREMLQRLSGERVHLRIEEAAQGPIRIDRGQLQQILLNLVLNARDAMCDGGLITIETQDRPFSSEDSRPALCLRVSDNGHGMDRETLPRVFEPFFTTKIEGRGNGLGLATVYEIVKQAGGTISVQSSPGNGACFEMTFPCATKIDGNESPREQQTMTTMGGEETVLLVEDNNLVRASVSEILRSAGYHVFEAASGQEALAIAHKQHEIDLLLTDLAMPGLTGLQLSAKMRKFKPGLPVVCTSGYAPNDRLDAWDGRNIALLRKPFSPHELLEGIRQVLDAKLSASYTAGKR